MFFWKQKGYCLDQAQFKTRDSCVQCEAERRQRRSQMSGRHVPNSVIMLMDK